MGAIPFGLIFGALATSSGLSAAGTLAMSAIVFAGSAQFIALGMLATGTAWPIIVLTTFVVNLRHSLYATALTPHIKHLAQKWQIPLAFWLTDETFAVALHPAGCLAAQALVLPRFSPGYVHQLAALHLFGPDRRRDDAQCGSLAGGLEFAMLVTIGPYQ